MFEWAPDSISLFQRLRISENVSIFFVTAAFVISLSPVFSGQRLFGNDIPVLSEPKKRIAGIAGSFLLTFCVFGFIPVFPAPADVSAIDLPHCEIESSWESNERYSIHWFADSEHNFYSRLVNDNSLLAVDPLESFTFNWDPTDAIKIFELQVGNRFGVCTDAIEVWDPNFDYSMPLECSISSSLTSAQPGDEYSIFWSVAGPELTLIQINGTGADRQDSAVYTFQENEQERFVLSARTRHASCTQGGCYPKIKLNFASSFGSAT